MDRTKVMDLADKAGGLFRLTVLLQKRVRELVGGAQPLVEIGEESNPINIAMKEVEEGAIELVDLSVEELAALEAETQMATEEAEILEALRSRVSDSAATPAAPAKAAPKAAATPDASPAAAAPAEPPTAPAAPAAETPAAEAKAPPAADEAPATPPAADTETATDDKSD